MVRSLGLISKSVEALFRLELIHPGYRAIALKSMRGRQR